MKILLLIVLLVCLQGCAPESAALKDQPDDGRAVQFREHRHDIEQRLGQSVGIVPRSDGGFAELYLEPICGSGCTGIAGACEADARALSSCAGETAKSRHAVHGDCRWRRVFVQYDETDRVLSVLVERRQNHARFVCSAGLWPVAGSLS